MNKSQLKYVVALATFLILGNSEAGQLCKSNIVSSTPYSKFNLSIPGIAIDKKARLMWLRCDEGQQWISSGCSGTQQFFTWFEGLKYVDQLNKSGGVYGHSDWRVPNINELSSIVEQSCYHPAFHMGIFPGVSRDWGFWSSSPLMFGEAGRVWYIDSTSGQATPFDSEGVANLRLVRDYN